MSTTVDYLKTKPVGTCKVCGINLWREHGNQPAPHTFPCGLQGCNHTNPNKLNQPFLLSHTGSSLALITG